jgi:hypothetical protein
MKNLSIEFLLRRAVPPLCAGLFLAAAAAVSAIDRR